MMHLLAIFFKIIRRIIERKYIPVFRWYQRYQIQSICIVVFPITGYKIMYSRIGHI